MASDSDYTSFLEKANQDPSSGVSKTQSSSSQKISLKAIDSESNVPKALKEAVKDQFYVSDADEEFTPVSLACPSSNLPSADKFKQLVQHPDEQAEVELMGTKEWDPRGQYGDVLKGIEGVSKGEVKVYKVGLGGTRFEYWVLGMGKEGGRVVGVRAAAVES